MRMNDELDRPRRGYAASKEQIRTRLKRIEGQIRGLDRMSRTATASTC